jgi:hypothetical protein
MSRTFLYRCPNMCSTRLFYRQTQRASIAVTDPDLIRFVEAQVSVRHRTFGASSHPGATIFLLRIEGGSARFFSWFSAMASLAPTNAHLNCEGVSLAPANWRHARSGLSGRFEPMELGVFEAELTPVDGEYRPKPARARQALRHHVFRQTSLF